MSKEALEYFEEVLGFGQENWTPQTVSPWGYVETMWPWNDLFRAHQPNLSTLPYRAEFEGEADDAILRLANAGPPEAWLNCSPGCWRVLLERYLQMQKVALANEAAGEAGITFLPLGLTDVQKRTGLALLLLLRMKLLWPAADRPEAEAFGQIPGSFVRH